MPSLYLIVASGTAQRRLLRETTENFEKKGYVMSLKQEGGDWCSLLADNASLGLFDENRLIIVDDALLMGAMPEKLSFMLQKESSVVIVLVYDSDPSKLIPKSAMEKCTVLKPEEFPRWPRERQAWVRTLANKMNVNIDTGGAALIVELLDDPEEIRSQLLSLSLLKPKSVITASDVKSMCLDDGSKNLLRLLDGLCAKDAVSVLSSVKAMSGASKTDDLIPLLSAIHNRMRLAWYAACCRGNESMMANALGARDYAWRMAQKASTFYSASALTSFVTGIIALNIGEKSGTSAGWNELETLLITLLSDKK